MLKRCFDFIFAALALVILTPLILYAFFRIKREGGGPIFFRGERTGLNGKPFRIFKLRTMVTDAEKIGGPSTADDDPRVTCIGKILRKYKLDELPQLVNVLQGDMSIVGPRPEVKHYTDLFTKEEKIILSVRPGITDWASIWNVDEGALLKGSDDPENAYMRHIRPTKLRLQMKYVREQSFWVDLKIIFLTILAIIQPESQAVREIREGS
jgi:lipopolysaccharide/colanic/teichoic acid biosynthesis glycosyltransferase